VLIGPAATFHRIPQFYIHMFIPKALYLFFPWLPGQSRMIRHSLNWIHAGLPSEHVWLFRISRARVMRIIPSRELADGGGENSLVHIPPA
jgi:hypothetical protein